MRVLFQKVQIAADALASTSETLDESSIVESINNLDKMLEEPTNASNSNKEGSSLLSSGQKEKKSKLPSY